MEYKTDSLLVHLARAGDEDACEKLVKKYYSSIYQYCFETEYGVSGMVREKKDSYEPIFIRGTAVGVFFIKYLRTLGFDATNDIFAENAWYFRNALVRANYNDLKNGVHETTEYLELFLRNLLLDEKNELHNRTMHISGRFAEVDIERVKVDIESGEVDIESTKVDIRNKLLSFSDTISEKTINHTVEIFSKCGKENCFGRTIVEEITGLKPSGASKLIKLLVDSEVIVPVTGHGKGKYRFQ